MTLADLAKEAAAHWNGRVVRLLRDRENAVFELALPRGRAALRLHRQGYQNDSAIKSELWLMAALAADGLAVPAALPDRVGRLLVPLSSGRLASAISWCEGSALGEAGVTFADPAPVVLSRHFALGRLLAEFHDAVDRLTLPLDFVRPNWDRAGLVGEAPLWGRFWDHSKASPAQSATLAESVSFLRDILTRPDLGAIGIIHADVLRENVLVNKESLSLIDFDDSGFGYRLYDLGTVMSQNLYEPAFVDIRAALIDGYRTLRPAAADLVDAFTLARVCASVGWAAQRLPLDHPTHASHLARAILAKNMFVPD